MSEQAAEEDLETGSPLKHPSVKKMLSITTTGVLGLIVAAWAWADSTTKVVTKHETLLVGSGPTDPGMEQRLRSLEQQHAAAEARRQDDHDRLSRIEASVERIAEKVGAKK